jgi:ABC-type bacteriocin/lantibiotic exporter with double-glycine peptidase domain
MKILKQETDKSCGVACLRSVLNHYGNNFSEKDIWNKCTPFDLEKGNIRNPIINLGTTALKFGMDVEYIGYNPILVNNNSSEDLEKFLKEKSKNYFSYGKYYVDEALEFLKLNGKLKLELLNVDKVKEIIDKEKFAIIEIKPEFISKNTPPGHIHKVIISGYTDKGFKVLNPSDTKEYFWNFDIFLIAFYAANAEMLIINKK